MVLSWVGKVLGKTAHAVVTELAKIDEDTRLLLVRFLIRAGKSPDPNRFIKEKIGKILDEQDAGRGPSSVHVQFPYREVKKP